MFEKFWTFFRKKIRKKNNPSESPRKWVKFFLRGSKIFSEGGTLINFENGGRGGHPYQFQKGRVGRKTLDPTRLCPDFELARQFLNLQTHPSNTNLRLASWCLIKNFFNFVPVVFTFRFSERERMELQNFGQRGEGDKNAMFSGKKRPKRYRL